jgi:anoctamin-10
MHSTPVIPTSRFTSLHTSKKNDDTVCSSYTPLVADADRDDYEQLDDYMEIVIQLGYVTLFASAYPLASLIAIVANLVEIHADCFKLTHVCQHPCPMRTDGCGMWNTLASSIIWLSALTNFLIFGFTTD